MPRGGGGGDTVSLWGLALSDNMDEFMSLSSLASPVVELGS